ncbi:DUF885 family protein [Streptomonospora nanhaiensis]|uniref:DUF885 family protein n=1 Tax=Streptomonospora nanhaiensis TaxID=1323731 RepID=UPI001C37F70F|nr:DUF885 family protein [Streptomonospora nanhaiensis]MBV2365541.1 DUF885 domain-containing protein [Streptomonospora nanhaiensis]MBX9391533.1 DUF885 domain-containing protein [Streptomonospora nanhaiensis]
MDDYPARLRAIADLNVASAREEGGRHEYDGVVGDLSPEGVTAGLARLGRGDPFADAHDEAHARAAEEALRVELGELELHRSNPLRHVFELDVSCYDREYAPEAERRAARDRHLAAWPDAVGAAIAALDRVSAPTATALLDAVRGLAAGVPEDVPAEVRDPALSAHRRLVTHLERAQREGPRDAALGGAALARYMGAGEALEVDLDRLRAQADTERDRLMARLAESAGRLAPGRPPLETARELLRDHPAPDGVLDAARTWTRLCLDFTRERDLVPYHDGRCEVRLSPPSGRWATAALGWSGPAEADAPSSFFVTPPDPAWSETETAEWMELFSATTLPAIGVHEVAPGHFSHGRALRRAQGQVRRSLFSLSFVEGWAHYTEELCVEEGFGAYAEEALGADAGSFTAAHFEVGVWVEALIRVTRLSSAIGVHTGEMTVEDAARRFAADTPHTGPAALAEARRALFDPTYGRYTWGKLAILDLREQARRRWGSGFSLRRFHAALMELGAPPLGLLGTALERG